MVYSYRLDPHIDQNARQTDAFRMRNKCANSVMAIRHVRVTTVQTMTIVENCLSFFSKSFIHGEFHG